MTLLLGCHPAVQRVEAWAPHAAAAAASYLATASASAPASLAAVAADSGGGGDDAKKWTRLNKALLGVQARVGRRISQTCVEGAMWVKGCRRGP